MSLPKSKQYNCVQSSHETRYKNIILYKMYGKKISRKKYWSRKCFAPVEYFTLPAQVNFCLIFSYSFYLQPIMPMGYMYIYSIAFGGTERNLLLAAGAA